MDAIIKLDQVRFAFSDGQEPFFAHVNMSFAARALHVIAGGNGCGKSTLMRLLLGRVLPGEQLTGTLTRQGTVRLVCQRYDDLLAPSFTAQQHMAFAQLGKYPFLGALSQVKLPEVLHNFAIPADVPVGKLSGGQRQMLAIALCLQQSTDVLLLDEPTAALDEENAAQFFKFVRYLIDVQGLTVILICHQREHVQTCAVNSLVQITRVPGVYTREVTQI